MSEHDASRVVRLDCDHLAVRKEHRWITAEGESECARCASRKQKSDKRAGA